METTTVNAIVLKETDISLVVMVEDGPTYISRGVHEKKGKGAPRVDGRSIYWRRAMGVRMSKQVRINKKHILAGSDNLGVADPRKEDDTRVRQGVLVLPKWVAEQNGIWKREQPVILPVVAQNEIA